MSRLGPTAGTYYVADLVAELGVEGAAHRPGRWWGRGAAGLGLTGPVEGDDLAAVLAGRRPGTDRSLSRHRHATSGYDLTFAAPKSVSALFALGDRELAATVLDAHRRSVDAAATYVAAHALAAPRARAGARELVPVEGPIAAAFTHGVSRLLDPHLHTHVVVANVAHGRDGRWTALDGRGVFAHGRAAGHAYDAHLRRELSDRLGLEWSPRRSGAYELVDVDPAVLGAFSGRQAEIRAALGPGEHASRRAHTVAWAATRAPKGAERTPDELRRSWWSTARDAGTEPADVQRLVRGRTGARAHRTGPGVGDEVDEHRFAAALSRTPHAGAARRDVVGAWAGALAGGARVPDIERCVDTIAAWGGELGVAERQRPLAGLVPAPYLLRALGPRPASPEALTTWQRAAASVDRYRRRWSVDRLDAVGPSGAPRLGPADSVRHPLGISGSPEELARLPARRLADHLATEREVADARRRLGRHRGREADVPERALGLGVPDLGVGLG